jgi:hypothetical protein
MDEDLARFMAELKSTVDGLTNEMKAHHRQQEGRMSNIEKRLAELSGSVALVLHRSEDNKKKSGVWRMLMPPFIAD